MILPGFARLPLLGLACAAGGAVMALLVAGCTATPAVSLHPLSPALAGRGAIPFRLADSVIALGVPPESGDNKAAPSIDLQNATVRCPARGGGECSAAEVASVVTPADFAGATYAIETRARRFVETRLAPTYMPNSLRLAELAVEIKDHRLEVINAIGTAAAGFASQSGNVPDAVGPTLSLPLTIDGADARAADSRGAQCRPGIVAAGAGGCHPLPRNPGWSYRLIATDDPGAQGFLARRDLDAVRDVMVASICRPARLEIDFTDELGVRPMLTLNLTVIDPDWLSTMPLPPKGELVFHSHCGIDLKRQEVTEIGIDALTRALFDQVAAVRAASK
ncbi:hypothetical protein IP88_02035 [alpha proteobacterium AAP81b]|nr:hypothetical protein IP88_02035 [alpha proteobacterium AAP81b]